MMGPNAAGEFVSFAHSCPSCGTHMPLPEYKDKPCPKCKGIQSNVPNVPRLVKEHDAVTKTTLKDRLVVAQTKEVHTVVDVTTGKWLGDYSSFDGSDEYGHRRFP